MDGREDPGVRGNFVSGAKDTFFVDASACAGASAIVGSAARMRDDSVDGLVNLGKGAGNWKKYRRSSRKVES